MLMLHFCCLPSPGSLLPAIQQHYQINFIIVSIIFLCNLVGWILSAILTVRPFPFVPTGRLWHATSHLLFSLRQFLLISQPISLDRLGFGPTVTLAAGLCIIPPVLVLPLPPFGLLAASYVLSGKWNIFSTHIKSLLLIDPHEHYHPQV